METEHHDTSIVRRTRRTPGARTAVPDDRGLRHPRSGGAALARRLRRIRSSRSGRRAARLRLGALAAALVVAWLTHDQWIRTESLQRAWGTTTHVVVSIRDLTDGDPLDATSVTVREVPVTLLPARPLRTVQPDQRAARSVETGRILVEADVHRPDGGPTATKLAPGRAGVVVPVEPGAIAVAVGDRVDVVRSTTAGAGTVVATDAEVLAVTPEAVTLSVAGSTAADVAGLALAEPLGLAVRPPPQPP